MNAGRWGIGTNGWVGKWDGVGDGWGDRRRDNRVEL